MLINDLEKFGTNIQGEILFDFKIKNFNWFNIGGKTRIFFKPNSLKELVEFLKLYSKRGKIFEDLKSFNDTFSKILKNGDFLMIKGSNETKLNEVSKNLLRGRMNAL